MSDSNATELLRKLLDERGVKYIKDSEYVTTVLMDDKMIRYYGYDGDFSVEVLFPRARLNGTTWFTPEQAIAATLGEKPRDKTGEWLLDACNRAARDYVTQLEELVRDWQALYEHPDYGDCCRLRKRMQALGIEVIDE